MGAVTFANRVDGAQGNKRIVEADVSWAASYATGGDTVALASLGLKQVDEVRVPSHRLNGVAVTNAQAQEGKTVQLAGTVSAPTLKLFDAADTEVTAATNNTTTTIPVWFVGSS